MEFAAYTNAWAKSEVLQGKMMITAGIFLALIFTGIYRSENVFLKGSLVPLGLMLAILLGYGSFILYSRPAHAKEIIGLYQKSPDEAIKKEITKHLNDNKAGKLLMRIYPFLMILSVIALPLASTHYHKGMALGFTLLFISTFVIDNGFVTRSDAFLSFLQQ
ncbi:hypothetical protein [Pedobacter rhodius]|uniref:Uncharacterized protein n=1 Tax=Pedobacter rhodius TaxID=3004098 RepID=A0ABT4KZR7_9SPHI|nr:hypothetical protein [Pedobacter sp. SJ11]MCZ4223333.1 hypothetical protein [Pedobacter sp. SJ11]